METIIVHGSPCQDFSLAGKQAGGDKGSGTRSSLLYETVRIVEKTKPKYVIWENVKNVLASGTKNFYYKPEIDLEIARPLSTDQNKRAGTTNYFSEQYLKNNEKLLIKNATKQGYLEATDGDSVNLAYPESETRRCRVGKEVSQTLQCNDSMGVVNNLRIRKLTPCEAFRLMGFDDSDFEKASKVNSNAQLYKQAGNSIVVNVMEAIFNNLLDKNEEYELIELFGGIGSPRKALTRQEYNFKSIAYVEIDKYAVKSYNAIYNENYDPTDITTYLIEEN